MAYLAEHGLDLFVHNMLDELAREKPDDPRKFMIQFIDQNFRDSAAMPVRRNAISAEPVDIAAPLPSRVDKSTVELAEMDSVLRKNVMFSHLDEDDRNEVYAYMVPIDVAAGTVVIRQGDDGTKFYAVRSGSLEVWKLTAPDAEEKLVQKIAAGGTFGELALIYGCPRAASVRAVSHCRLWEIDRVTFRRILMSATTKRRDLYEHFLDQVPILKPLTRYERMLVADALEPVAFEAGAVILRQGELGSSFFIIVDGEVKVTKQAGAGGEVEDCGTLGPSNFFGERALLTQEPRAATVTATTHVKAVTLDKDRFTMVMGPCEELLRQHMDEYTPRV